MLCRSRVLVIFDKLLKSSVIRAARSGYRHQSFTVSQRQKNAVCLKGTRHDCFGGPYIKYTTSSLHVNPNNELSHSPAVEVDLELERLLVDDVQNLKRNLEERNKRFNVEELVTDYKNLLAIQAEKREIEEERESIANQMKKIIKEKKEDSKEIKQKLMTRGKELREELQKLNRKVWDIEQIVLLAALQLPTELHSTVKKENDVLLTLGSVDETKEHSPDHVQLGKKSKMLEFSAVSPGAYYLTGELAHLEENLLQYYYNILQTAGIEEMSGPDMVKSIIAEGCAEDFSDVQKVFKIDDPNELDTVQASGQLQMKWDTTMHLVGCSSSSLAAYFAKMNIQEKSLPLEFFSTGRQYRPVSDSAWSGLLSVPQKSVIDLIGITKGVTESEEVFSNFANILWTAALDLDMPIRMVNIGSENLKSDESKRVEIQVWMPSIAQYVQFSHLSMGNDFTSRRLMTKYSDKTEDILNKNYCHMVHGCAANITHLLAAIIEMEHMDKKE